MKARPYTPLKPSSWLRRQVRDADYFVRTWGSDSAPPLVFLHGRNDTSITFQFLVDALGRDYRILAPDWRGHGHTRAASDGVWFHEFLADLNGLLDVLCPDAAVDIVGHSLGGNVASVYAGVRPERVHRLIVLDAFGMMPVSEGGFIESLSIWLGASHANRPRRDYPSIEAIAGRLCEANHRLAQDRALFLAQHISRQLPSGEWSWQFDPHLRRSMPFLRSLAEWSACWRRIQARALWVASSDPLAGTVRADSDAFAFAAEALGRERVRELPETGHNLQHDAPAPLAKLIEQFLEAESSSGD